MNFIFHLIHLFLIKKKLCIILCIYILYNNVTEQLEIKMHFVYGINNFVLVYGLKLSANLWHLCYLCSL